MVTVGDIVGGGFRLVRERRGSLAIWAVLYLAMNVGVVLAMHPFMTGVMAMQAAQDGSVGPDPGAMFQTIGTMFGAYALFMIGLLILYTAALRAATRPNESAFAYLRLGMDELRMLGVGIVLVVGFFILYIGLSLVMALLGVLIGVIARDAALPVIIALSVATLCAVIFVQVRFSLVFALTMLRGRIIIGESWNVTKGKFWTLFGAYVVLTLIVVATAMVLVTLTSGAYVAELVQNGFNPAGMQAAQAHQMERQFGTISVVTVLGWVLGALLGVFWIALGAGAAGAAAAGLLDDGFGDVAAIYE